MSDIRFMQIALELAEQGRGRVEPNPCVGALVVRDGEIVGRGAHLQFGGPHAEIHAIEDAGADACRGAKLYVTLEPCATEGKTPPCVHAVINAGFSRVVIAMRDPNPVNGGNGIEALTAAGIGITEGVLEEDAEELNRPFLTVHRKKRPWVLCKWAMSLDGKIATRKRDSKWITSDHARKLARATRGHHQAILVGIGTVLADNPRLTTEPHPDTGEEPIYTPTRVILDRSGRIPITSTVVSTAKEIPTIIVSGTEGDLENLDAAREAGCKIIALTRPHLKYALEQLANEGIQSVMIEGGSRILASAFAAGLVDEVLVFVAPKIVGGAEALSPVGGEGIELIKDAFGLTKFSGEQVGPDVLLHARVPHDD
jgi:diaminohydroxyphosphoribosylaminopyrimidine deaminase/5-amino-6-(5-phosphoribosylamino)uracil reductase